MLRIRRKFNLDKLKYIRIQQENNQYNGDIPIGADAQNIDFADGHNLQEIMGNYDYATDGSIKEKLDNLSVLDYEIKTSTTDINIVEV